MNAGVTACPTDDGYVCCVQINGSIRVDFDLEEIRKWLTDPVNLRVVLPSNIRYGDGRIIDIDGGNRGKAINLQRIFVRVKAIDPRRLATYRPDQSTGTLSR